MKGSYVFLLLAMAAQVSHVSSVACTDDDDCVATVYTTDTCSAEKECGCKDDFVPTAEGCAQRLPQPQIVTDGNSLEAETGASVVLRCVGQSADSTYAWIKDGGDETVSGEETDELEFTMGTDDVSYTCVEVGSQYELSSEESASVTVKHLDSTDDSEATLVLTVPSVVEEGVSYTPTCTGAPFGINPVIKDKDDQEVVDSITATEPADTDAFTCSFGDVEVTQPYPKLFVSLTSATVTSEGISSDVAFRTTDALPTLQCLTDPAQEYLSEDTKNTLSYSWSASDEWNTETVDIGADEAEYTGITCTVNDGVTDLKSSEFFTITVSDNYVEKPEIVVNPAAPVQTGSLTLQCACEDEEVVISWTKDGTLLTGQMDQTLQLNNLGDSLDPYVCTCTKDGFSASSEPTDVKISANLGTPQVEGSLDNNIYKTEGEATLTCTSPSSEGGIEYSWSKGTAEDVINGATGSTYTISDLKLEDAGDYYCTTKFNTLEPETSAPYTMVVELAGVPCETDQECDGDEESLTGACDAETSRCVCAEGFFVKGEECASGVSAVLGSLVGTVLTLLLAASFPRYFC